MVVYLITNLVNGKHYIGKTVQPLERRWGQHLSDARCGSQTYFLDAIRKHGAGAFSIVPLISILVTDPQLKEQEKFWIRQFNSNDPRYGYNLTAGGDGSLGCRHSVEARRKMSASRKGKSHSAEHNRKIGEASKGRKHSAETRRKMSYAHKGKILSAETCRKMSEFRKGKSRPAETRRKISEAKKGHEVSAETLRKISLTKFLKTVAWG